MFEIATQNSTATLVTAPNGNATEWLVSIGDGFEAIAGYFPIGEAIVTLPEIDRAIPTTVSLRFEVCNYMTGALFYAQSEYDANALARAIATDYARTLSEKSLPTETMTRALWDSLADNGNRPTDIAVRLLNADQSISGYGFSPDGFGAYYYPSLNALKAQH